MSLQNCIGYIILKLRASSPNILKHLIDGKIIAYQYYGEDRAWYGDRTYNLYTIDGKINDLTVNHNSLICNMIKNEISDVMDLIRQLDSFDAITEIENDYDDRIYVINDKGIKLLSLSDDELKTMVEYVKNNYALREDLNKQLMKEHIAATLRYNDYVNELVGEYKRI